MTVVRRGEPVEIRRVEDAASAVRRAGGRLTEARRAVVEALLAAEGPITADQIAEGLPGRPLDRASVYRNLERLEELGAVLHVHIGHGPGLYTLAHGDSRDYLVCERCGKVTTVASRKLDRARAEIRKATGYEARFNHFPIQGLCQRCTRSAP